MAIPSLLGSYIDQTYQRLVQTTGSGTEFADGLGNPITFGTTNTGSLLLTASVANNTITFTKGDGSTFPITVNTGSGGGGVTFPYTGSAIITGSLIVTGSTRSTLGFTGSLQGTASWATNAQTASYVLNAVSSSFASTASSADAFTVRGNLIVSGNMTFGDTTTDNITMNASTMSLGSGTGILNIDSNTLYVDGANNRVGIGTTSPLMSFDVNGGGSFTSPLRIGGGTYVSNAYNLQINCNTSFDTPIRIQGGYGTIQIEKNASATSAIAIGLSKPGVNIGDDYVLSLYNTTTGSWIERMRFTQAGNLLITGSMQLSGSSLKIDIPSKASGYVLTSDALGNATWQIVGAGTGFPFNGDAIITGSLLVSGSGLTVSGSTSLFGGPIIIDIPSKVNGYVLTTDASGNATWQSAGAGAAFPYTGNAVITGSLILSGSGLTVNGPTALTGSLLVSEHLEVSLGSIVPYYTVTGIDLSAATYDITGSGIFEIVNASGNITFPDPSTHDGQTIFVINTVNGTNATIDNTNTYAPYTAGTNTQLAAIGTEDMWNFVSIGGKWRGMTSFK